MENFVVTSGIEAGVFSAIGATNEILISWFHSDEKKYHDHLLTKRLEIVSFNGNISKLDGRPVVHAHGSFSDVELHNRSGHVKKLVVSTTCEMSLVTLSGEVNREFDPETGLNIMI